VENVFDLNGVCFTRQRARHKIQIISHSDHNESAPALGDSEFFALNQEVSRFEIRPSIEPLITQGGYGRIEPVPGRQSVSQTCRVLKIPQYHWEYQFPQNPGGQESRHVLENKDRRPMPGDNSQVFTVQVNPVIIGADSAGPCSTHYRVGLARGSANENPIVTAGQCLSDPIIHHAVLYPPEFGEPCLALCGFCSG
jgi:hypothetical protein